MKTIHEELKKLAAIMDATTDEKNAESKRNVSF